MTSKAYMVAIGILLVALAAFSGAFTLHVSTDTIHTTGTTATIYAYTDQHAAFSVESEFTNARVENFGNHAKISLLAPDCLIGTESIAIRASNGTQTLLETIALANTPREACTTYIRTQPLSSAIENPKSLTFSHTFDATHYDLSLNVDKSCTPITQGQTAKIRMRITNNGAALTAQLHAIDDQTHTTLSKDQITLQQNELSEAIAYIQADTPGTQHVAIQALRQGIVIGSTTACVRVEQDDRAMLTIPSNIAANQCQGANVQAEVYNIGTNAQTFIVDGDGISPVSVYLSAQEKKSVTLYLNTSPLRLNENVVAIRATGEQTQGTAYTIVNVASCQPAVTTELVNPQNNSLSWAVLITNNQDTPMNNVTLHIEGIAKTWTQTSQSADIPAHGQALLGASVNRTTDESATPIITVLANGTPVSQQNAPAISQRPPVTGAVIGLDLQDSYTLSIILLLLVGVFILFMAANAFYRAHA